MQAGFLGLVAAIDAPGFAPAKARLTWRSYWQITDAIKAHIAANTSLVPRGDWRTQRTLRAGNGSPPLPRARLRGNASRL